MTPRPALDGWKRAGDQLLEIDGMNGYVSPRLGVQFDLSQGELILIDPAGKRFLTYGELALERDAIAEERDAIAEERDAIAKERDAIAEERDALAEERDAIAEERDAIARESLRLSSARSTGGTDAIAWPAAAVVILRSGHRMSG